MTPSILVVDDDGALLALLVRFFEKRGWDVEHAASGAGALQRFETARPDLVLLDLGLPDMSGIDVLRRLRERGGDTGVVMFTGHGDIPAAVDAMRLGAEDFVVKPAELQHVGAVLDRALERVRHRRGNRALAAEAPRAAGIDLGPSPMMRDLGRAVDRLAETDSTVLVTGETGTGKGWVAGRIHERSGRAAGPFVQLNCSGMSPEILRAELFGAGGPTGRGGGPAGAFRIAIGGTLFLDEVDELPHALQPELLRELDDPHGVRVIAASSLPPRALALAGRLRDELYHRLAAFPLHLPALRERTADDIAFLAYRLLDQVRRRLGAGPVRIADPALDRLTGYAWPGNIRELRNVLERVLILADQATTIELYHLPPEILTASAAAEAEAELTLEAVERRHIVRILEETGGNRSRAARILGISRATLYDKLDRYGLHAVGR